MSTLEERLGAALTARTEQVQPDDLTPGKAPATVVPLHTRVRPRVYAVLAAAAAAAVVVVVTIGGGAPHEAEPAPSVPTPTPTPTPSPTSRSPLRQVPVIEPARPHADLSRILPSSDFSVDGADTMGYRGSATLDDGTQLELYGRYGATRVSDGQATLSVTSGGVERDLVFGAGASPQIDTTPVDLGNGPVGYLVARPEGGDASSYGLIVDTGTSLIYLEQGQPRGGSLVPFYLGSGESNGLGNTTWVAADGSGLYTRYTSAGQRAERVHLVEWGITGPAASPHLTVTSLGIACGDDPINPTTYTRC